MAKPSSILFVTSEVFPFVKVSPIADVSASLPLALKEKGLDVRVMMPKYGHVSERKNRIHDINRLRDMPVPINGTDIFATIKSSSISNSRSKVQTYITTNDEYFNSHKGVYSDLKTGEEFKNNAERFIYFARSVVETCVLLEWYPEIIHCNNWHAALVPALAKILYPKKFNKTKFILTVHDFSDQGGFAWSNFERMGIDEDKFGENFKHKNKFNF
ncbi:glycogen/starch synthase, partial [Candidatus Kapabacteria bacterium]|nr:glycogen/starch synthase [Candidatus Kapabacteria bacterium]